MKIYYNKQVGDDFKKLSGILKRDFKVITHTHYDNGYIAVVQLKINPKKIYFIRQGNELKYKEERGN